MKCITTTYHGPTSTKPARIKAKDGDGNYVWYKPDNDQSHADQDTHYQAARALQDKMGWTGLMASGWQKAGTWVHVFTE